MLRAFIAIKLSEELKGHIGEVQAELKRRAPGLSGLAWVKSETMHLTLRFLGDIAESQVQALGEALRRAASSAKPFELEVRRLGALPDVRFARVLFAGVNGDDPAMEELMGLQVAIEIEVAGLGFRSEDRPFRPHLTLARVRDRKAAAPLLNMKSLYDYVDRAFGCFQVRSIALIRSELRPAGAVYTTLVEVPFGAGV